MLNRNGNSFHRTGILVFVNFNEILYGFVVNSFATFTFEGGFVLTKVNVLLLAEVDFDIATDYEECQTILSSHQCGFLLRQDNFFCEYYVCFLTPYCIGWLFRRLFRDIFAVISAAVFSFIQLGSGILQAMVCTFETITKLSGLLFSLWFIYYMKPDCERYADRDR